MANRVFTSEELKQMCVRPVDAAVEAATAGDREKLVEWVDKMYKAAVRSFNLRRNWDRGLTDKIYEKQGVEGIAAVMKNCTFTEAQLQELLVTEDYIEEIYRAFDAGEKEQVVEKIQTLHKMSREFHDIRIKWENYLMGYIYEEIGGDDLYEAMRKVVSSYNAAPIETAREGDFRKRVEQTIWGLHSHGEPLYAIEDDEKVSVYMNPCGSGQMTLCGPSPNYVADGALPGLLRARPRSGDSVHRGSGLPLFRQLPLPGAEGSQLEICTSILRVLCLQGQQRNSR